MGLHLFEIKEELCLKIRTLNLGTLMNYSRRDLQLSNKTPVSTSQSQAWEPGFRS